MIDDQVNGQFEEFLNSFADFSSQDGEITSLVRMKSINHITIIQLVNYFTKPRIYDIIYIE